MVKLNKQWAPDPRQPPSCIVCAACDSLVFGVRTFGDPCPYCKSPLKWGSYTRVCRECGNSMTSGNPLLVRWCLACNRPTVWAKKSARWPRCRLVSETKGTKYTTVCITLKVRGEHVEIVKRSDNGNDAYVSCAAMRDIPDVQ